MIMMIQNLPGCQGSGAGPLRLRHRAMAGNLGFKITQTGPFGSLIEVHFGYRHRASGLCQSNGFTSVIEHRRKHPVPGFS
jgi:hypothetical protein